MKPNRSRSTALRFLPLAGLLALGCLGMYLSLAAPVPEGKPTAYPAWWFEREVITRTDPTKASPVHPADYPPAADFAALNQGQLKQFATAAFDELQAHLPGGAGPAITALVQSWYVLDGDTFQLDAKGRRIPLVTEKTSDFAPVTHGQLKELARHFFDRLQAELYYPTEQTYPWAAPGAQPAADYAVANLGHIKSLFQFDLTTDSDKDGIPDWWEKAHGLNSKDPSDALALSAGGVLTNQAAYVYNLNPNDPNAQVSAYSLASLFPAVVIKAGDITVDGSAANAVQIGTSPVPLIVNGDFQKDVKTELTYQSPSVPLLDRRRWYCKQQSSPGWKAVGGYKADPADSGTRVDRLQYEVQQRINDYVLPSWFTDINGTSQSGKLNQYCELDAHWERLNEANSVITNSYEEGRSVRSRVSDHGIKQKVELVRGNYVLIFDYRDRTGVDNDFSVWAEENGNPSVFENFLVDQSAAGTGAGTWKRAKITFTVDGGNPSLTTLPILLKLDVKASTHDSYGVFIDNVILLRVDLDAMKHNSTTDELPEDQEADPGAYLPLNNDDDDYDTNNTADKDQLDGMGNWAAITGESDLLEIKLHKVEPSVSGSYYTLDIPSNVRIWEQRNRSTRVIGTIDAGTTTEFDATVDKTLYIEGITAGEDTIKVNWKKGSATVSNCDEIKVTVLDWSGPLNVPGYSIHQYKVTSPPANGKWNTPTGGTIKTGSNTSDVTILWDEGPVVGKAIYQADTNYIWDLEVNVVKVTIAGPDTGAPFSKNVPADGADFTDSNGVFCKRVVSGDPFGVSWKAKVTLAGPTGNRGVDMMRIGFVQNVKQIKERGTYSTVGKTLKSNIEGTLYLDTTDASLMRPYYVDTGSGVFFNPSSTLLTKTIEADDTPASGPPLTFDQGATVAAGDDVVDLMELDWAFTLYVTARTTDARNDADKKYTSRAKGDWSFNGTGGVSQTAPWGWTPGSVNTIPTGWTDVTDGSVPTKSNATDTQYNSVLTTETFSE